MHHALKEIESKKKNSVWCVSFVCVCVCGDRKRKTNETKFN